MKTSSTSSCAAVNGKSVRNLRELVKIVEGCKHEYLKIELDQSIQIVLETKAAKKSTKEILHTHCIPERVERGLALSARRALQRRR